MRISDWSSDVCSSDLDDDLDVFHPASGEVDGVDEAGRGDDRGAMLIIMEHGNVHPFPERLFDDEAFGRLDIFKVDSAKARLHQRNRVDASIRILGVHFEVDRKIASASCRERVCQYV